MADNSLNNRVVKATKWSAITEIVAKLVTPITNMVLARLLTPEAFGVVTTITMVTTFAELFTDAGFQKYLIQHEFRDERDKDESTCVAFWSNLCLSLLIWVVICLFADPLAALVGNPGLGLVLIVACAGIPLAAFSSIQMALYKRSLDFKTLFKVRMVGILIPLFVTIPLAFYMRSYWALIIGTLARETVNAFLLTWYSEWKPKLFYSFKKLKEMFSFTMWSMLEQVSIWLTNYVDVFIVGTKLSQYYLGLYKTSSTLVGQIMGLITATTTPILFSALSRLQDDESEFQRLFFKFQKLVGLLVVPLGVGIFIFDDFVTEILLGSQWTEAAGFVGLWGLTSSLTITLSYYSSEVYRAKGRPKLSVLSQVLHIVVLWPVILWSIKYGFETLYVARSLVRIELIVVNMCIMGWVIKMPVGRMFTNIMPSCIAAAAMCLVLLFPEPGGFLANILYVVAAAAIYFVVIMLFPQERKVLFNIPQIIKNK